ncbi:hypothetical protein MPF13_01625 [Polaribacter sp. Z022]|nr:hypothetical protein [Polaribacter sp. Z022]
MFNQEINEELIKIQESFFCNTLKSRYGYSDLINMWEQFTEECIEGYGWNIYEYDNDVSIRELIELVISNEKLKLSKEHKYFKKKIHNIDDKLKLLFFDEVKRNTGKFWWNRGILKEAGEEYMNDLQDEYNVKIKLK